MMGNKMKRSEQKAKIEELYRQIEELRDMEIEEDGFWKPKYNGNYWYFSTDTCRVFNTFWGPTHVHENRLNVGNMYKTKEEAEFQLERMNVLGELKKFSCKFRNGESNHYIFLNCNTNELGIVVSDAYISLNVYFESNARRKKLLRQSEKIELRSICLRWKNDTKI